MSCVSSTHKHLRKLIHEEGYIDTKTDAGLDWERARMKPRWRMAKDMFSMRVDVYVFV